MKPRLIILSDIGGFTNCDWIEEYVQHFTKSFEVQLYDCCELSGIDIIGQTVEIIHHQFISTGIEKAVNRLLELEKGFIHVLAFSIGGTIAWKANLLGLKVNMLIAISSTRLRFENEKPASDIQLIYGDNDLNKPSNDWFEKLNINAEIVENASHDFYKESKLIPSIVTRFI